MSIVVLIHSYTIPWCVFKKKTIRLIALGKKIYANVLIFKLYKKHNVCPNIQCNLMCEVKRSVIKSSKFTKAFFSNWIQ